MAVYPNIKFYRRADAPSNPKDGYIWFDVTNKRLKIYKTSDWEDYSGQLVDASFANNILTITKQDKSTVSVDLTGLTTVDSRIATAIEGLDATAGSTSFNQNTDSAVTTSHVAVQVVETNGKLTKVTVAENDIASASALNTLDEKVTTLIGSDSSKSVRKIANEELAKVLLADGDDEYGAEKNFATLQELATWLEQHPENAAAMNEDIQTIKESYVSSLTDSATYVELNNSKGAITLTDTALQTKISNLEQAISNAASAGVTSFGGKTGAITVTANSKNNGTVNFAVSEDKVLSGTVYGLGSLAYKSSLAKADVGLSNVDNLAAANYLTDLSSNTTDAVSITVGGTTKSISAATMKTSLGLKSAAYTEASAYATSSQGSKADTALQPSDIATGTANGTISVKNTNVAVYGLGTAAYKADTAFASSEQGTLAASALQKVTSDSTYLTIGNKAQDTNDGNKYFQKIIPVIGTYGSTDGLATTSATATYLETYVDTVIDSVFAWAEF